MNSITQKYLPEISDEKLQEIKGDFISEVLHKDLERYDGVGAQKGIFPNEKQFEIILDRSAFFGTGFYGIEPERHGEYFDCDVYECYKTVPTDPRWFLEAFDKFKGKAPNLNYSATYHIPDYVAMIYYLGKINGTKENNEK